MVINYSYKYFREETIRPVKIRQYFYLRHINHLGHSLPESILCIITVWYMVRRERMETRRQEVEIDRTRIEGGKSPGTAVSTVSYKKKKVRACRSWSCVVANLLLH